MMNVDSNILETPFDDMQALPPDVVSLLRLRLRKVALAPGEGVSRLFLKAQALLFGGYRDALVYSPGQPVTFSEEAFLAQKPGSPLQAFHRRAVHLQLFKQFIEGRLEKLNTGEGFSDLFEQEITCIGDSSGTLRSYQLWADNIKVLTTKHLFTVYYWINLIPPQSVGRVILFIYTGEDIEAQRRETCPTSHCPGVMWGLG